MAILIRASSHLYARKSYPLSARLPPANLFSSAIKMEGTSSTAEGAKDEKPSKIFVAGSTGKTGKRIVELLLSKGFVVRAGARDPEKARSSLPQDANLQIVRADVTVGSEKLAEAIGDVEAVVCATSFQPSFDVFAPWKAEKYIKSSGINYTIVRPGGLRNDPRTGNIVMEPEDTLYEGSISRDQVAEVIVEALQFPESYLKVVEIVSRVEAPKRPLKDLFSSIKQK